MRNAFGKGEKKNKFTVGVGVALTSDEMLENALDARPGSQEDIQQQLSQQWEAEQAMYASVEDQIRALHKQTIQRRANEAGLFSKNAEILALRAQALRTEGRVTRLANDLRRVYRQVPQVVQQKLSQSAEKFSEQSKKELQLLSTEHRMEHLKWMGALDLSQRIDVTEAEIQDVTSSIAGARRILENGNELAHQIGKKMHHLEAVLLGFEEVWTRVTSDVATSPQFSGTPREAVEAVQTSLREAELVVGFITAASDHMRSRFGVVTAEGGDL